MATEEKRRILQAILVLAICVPRLPAQAGYGGGSGTAEDPYQIRTAEQMNAVGAEPNDWDKHFRLMADIDLSAFDGQEGRPPFRIIAPDTNADEPWSQRYAFSGVFDGNGHTIANFTHTSTDRYTYAGLFGYVGGPTGEIRNLGLLNAAVDVGEGWSVGALAGSNTGVVIHCYSTGSVRGARNCVGGLVGYNFGAVVGCYSAVAVGGDGWHAGGLVGGNDEGAVIHCYSQGPVTGKSDVGGLLGYNLEGNLVHCYSTGTVSSVSGRCGGLVGVSINWEGAVVRCFWDVQTSNQTGSLAGTGLTTAQMQDIQTYLQARWDFGGNTDDGAAEIWEMPAGGGYPVLAFFQGHKPAQLQGEGTPEEPYLISTASDLGAMAGYSPAAHYRLTAPLDLSGMRWGAAVVPNLRGTFDGGGLTISHLTMAGDSHLGLFGWLGREAQISNLGIVDVNTTGDGIYDAGLVARNDGVILRCFIAGAVRGDLMTGGLVGLNKGTVAQCYSTATVSGKYAGGLLGSNQGSVTHCYSAARDGPAQPLAGTDYGATIDCLYESLGGGRGSRTGESYVPPGARGMMRSQMQDERTFLEAGWDWVDETTNGTSEVWQMPEEGGYPVLAIFGGRRPLRLRGQGTPADPYLISDALELGAMTYHSSWAHYRLTAPLDLSGIRWAVPIMPLFRGVFDGSGLIVSHLEIGGGGNLGLFGTLLPGAEIRDLGITDCIVSNFSSGLHVGGLAGSNEGVVRRCYSTGLVRSDGQDVGGLIGYNGGTVSQCFNTARVTGVLPDVGGLVAINGGTLTDCYNLGAVSGGTQSVGGLVGENRGAALHCFSTGMVSGADAGVGGLCGLRMGPPGGDISGCFWDTQTSGQMASYGGTGKTTAEMQTATTFLVAGWDFIGETANGTEDVWWIEEGQDYPRLWWEAVGE
jgi:hypothetical protein